jgi:hypothetical protein
VKEWSAEGLGSERNGQLRGLAMKEWAAEGLGSERNGQLKGWKVNRNWQ